jgi:hypothetical protein
MPPIPIYRLCQPAIGPRLPALGFPQESETGDNAPWTRDSVISPADGQALAETHDTAALMTTAAIGTSDFDR